MKIQKFGDYYINLEKIIYVHRFEPQITPSRPALPGTNNQGGLYVCFDNQELTLYQDDPGYAEFLSWLDQA